MTTFDLPITDTDFADLPHGDRPVSNQPESAPVDGHVERTEAPATGEGNAPASVRGHETEASVTLPELSVAELSAFVVPELDLPDIGEASFGAGAALVETVHGVDNRVQIQNTDTYPWRVHCSLIITARDGSQWIGTGWFIGPRTVVTAGHVVFIHAPGTPRHGWVRSIRVMPGRNGASLPFGAVVSNSFKSVLGWTGSGDENYDYGAIALPVSLGERTGWLGFASYDDATLSSSVVNLSGYPGDKPAGTQWYAANKVAAVNARKVYYDIDTFGGQSGAALYRIVNGARYAVGVHCYGGATTNSATRINASVFANLASWKQNP